MFGFLKKKKLITNADYNFFEIIVNKLSSKYPYLVSQVSKDFIFDKVINKLGEDGTYGFVLNAELESKYSNPNLPSFFIIKDIGIWSNKNKRYVLLDLHIVEGMLSGYYLRESLSDLDCNKIDLSQIKEKTFKDKDKDELKLIIDNVKDELINKIDLDGTFKIEIPEGNFYTIKDLGDGNYLSVDSSGAVFKMIHDPYSVDKIFDDLSEFLDALKLEGVDSFYSKITE